MKSSACLIYGLPAARRLPELATGLLHRGNGAPRQSLAKVFWDNPQTDNPQTDNPQTGNPQPPGGTESAAGA